MKNGHINTAIKALQRQIDKYKQQAEGEVNKSIEHKQLAEFYATQASHLEDQIKSIRGEAVEEKPLV